MTDIAELALKVDARQVSSAAAELDRFSKSGNDAGNSADRFVASLKKQADTLGMSVSKIRAYEAAQLNLTKEQQESVSASIRAIRAYEQTQDQLNKTSGGFNIAAKAAAGMAAAFAGISVAGLARETATLSQRFNELGIVMHAVGRNAGLSADEIDKTAQAVQKSGISMIESRRIIAQLISANIDLEKASKLARTAQDAAVIGQINSSQALQTMVHGITSAQVEVLRGIGINVNFENSYKKLAQQLGVATTDLSEYQKMQARVNVVLEEGQKNTGVYEASMNNAGKQMRSTERLAEDLKVKIGGLFDSVSMAAVQSYTGLLKTLDQAVTDLTQSGHIERWGDNIARVFAFIMDSGSAVVSIFKTIGFGIATAAEQAASILTLNFSRAMELGSSFNQMMVQEFSSLTKNQDAVNEQIRARRALAGATESTTNAIEREVKVIEQANNTGGKSTGARKAQISESQRFLDALSKEAAQLGKTSIEIRKMEAAKLGVSAAAKPFIDRIEAEERALRESEESMRNYQRRMSEAASLTEQFMTAEERFALTQENLNRKFAEGDISLTIYNRALADAKKKLVETGDAGKDAFGSLSQFAIQAARNVQTAFADFFFDPFDKGLKGLVSSFANAVRRLIAEAAALKTIQSLGIGSVLGLTATGAAASGGGGAGGGIASRALDLFNTGFGTTKLLSSLGGSLPGSTGAFFSGIGGGTVPGVSSQAALMGSSFGAVAGPLIANAVAVGIGSMIGGDKKVFGLNSTITSTIGAVFGGPIGAVLGGAVNALFGRGPLKQRGTTLSGTIGAEGFEEGQIQTDFRAKGGLFRSNKNDFARVDAVTGDIETDNRKLNAFAEDLARASRQIIGNINETVTAVGRSLNQVGESLGLGTDALNSFQTQIKLVSENGEFLRDEQIAEEIARISNEMAKSLLPNVESFSKAGESAVTTLQRIGAEFDVLVNSATILGLSLGQARELIQGTAISDRTAFVDASGGLEVLAAQASFFADNFLTDAERLQPAIQLLSEQMGELGLSADISKEQFKGLIQSFGQANGVTESTFRSLLSIAPLFVRVKDGIASLNGVLQDTVDFTERISDARSALITTYNRERSALQETANRFKDLAFTLKDASDSLSLSSLSPLTPGQRLDEARAQFNRDRLAANAGDQEALRRLPESGKAFLQASQIFNASSAEFTSDFNFVKGVLDSAAKLADVEAGVAERQLSVLEDQISRLIDIDNSVTSVEDAIRELTEAVLQSGGNASISDQAIRDFVNTPGRSTQDIIDAAVRFGISDDQYSRATGTPLPDISRATGGASISDQQIKDFFYANINNPRAIYDTAKQYGLTLRRVADAAGYPYAEIEKWVKSSNLPMFERGTDFVSKGGLAVLHPAEAVTPANHMRDMAAEIAALRRELSELRREQNQQTQALINVNLEANKINANMIIAANKEAEKGAAWREQNKVNVR